MDALTAAAQVSDAGSSASGSESERGEETSEEELSDSSYEDSVDEDTPWILKIREAYEGKNERTCMSVISHDDRSQRS